MSDLLRWITVFTCAFDIGCIAALYLRIGHSFLPKLWMRILMVASVGWLAAGANGAYARLGETLTWRTPVYAIAALLELISFLGLYHWYGTPKGRAHAAKMLEKETP